MLVDFVVRLSVTVEREAQKTESTHIIKYGGVAQLGEHLLCKQGVRGSIPLISTTERDLGYGEEEEDHRRKLNTGL